MKTLLTRALHRVQEVLRDIPTVVSRFTRQLASAPLALRLAIPIGVVVATSVTAGFSAMAYAERNDAAEGAFAQRQAFILDLGEQREKRSEYLQKMNADIAAAEQQIAAEREAARIAEEERRRAEEEAARRAAEQAAAAEAAAAEAAQTQAYGGGYGGPTPPIPSSCSGYGGNRAIGCAILGEYGFGLDQMGCLDALWTHESGWNHHATNPSSGAYGIPQALPAGKMASHGSDWQTNPATQIRWGLSYISARYGTPCGAWSFWQGNNWY